MRAKSVSLIPRLLGLAVLVAVEASAQEAGSLASNENRLDALQAQITEQKRQLEEMRQSLAAQERRLLGLQQALGEEALANARARGAPAMTMVPSLANGPTYVASAQQNAAPEAVGQAPESQTRPPEVAQIFDQPGVLTPANKLVLEPSLQYGYSTNDRVALVGYTIIPALLIGLIDVRQVDAEPGAAAPGLWLDGVAQDGLRFPLVDDRATHRVDVVWLRSAPPSAAPPEVPAAQ
jgi:hypothetical protein